MSVLLSLSDKVALISGGSRGIGAATVRMFTQAGAKVVFSYRAAKAQADALMNECGAAVCHAVACDLNAPESAAPLVRATVERFGRLDILVANHGVWLGDDIGIDQMPDQQWRNTLSINLDAVFGLVKHSVAQMKSQPRRGQDARATAGGTPAPSTSPAAGHIVLISSTSGQRGEAYHADYSATKGALISMTKSLSSELAPIGIYVNCVAPGWVDTDMSAATLADPKAGEAIRRTIPLGRVGEPEEIAAPVLFLCTEHAGFISGEIFNVNGGAVLVG